MSVAEVHERISQAAVEKANRFIISANLLPRYTGEVFTIEGDGTIAITLRPEYQAVPEDIRAYYTAVGEWALKEAFRENKKFIGGLIISEAKAGRDYLKTLKKP